MRFRFRIDSNGRWLRAGARQCSSEDEMITKILNENRPHWSITNANRNAADYFLGEEIVTIIVIIYD